MILLPSVPRTIKDNCWSADKPIHSMSVKEVLGVMNIDQLRANPMLATVVPIQKILRVSNAGHATF